MINVKDNELEKIVRKDIPMEFNELQMVKDQFSRIISVFNKNILPPYEILIHPSSICNLSCKWCIGSYVSRKDSVSELLDNNLKNVENMKKVVDDIISMKKVAKDYLTGEDNEFKVERVSFSGITGEPFVSKDSILYAIDKLSDAGIRVGIFTNGTLINEDMFDTLLKLKYLLISIDAGNNKTYSKLKCNNKETKTFDEIITTIEKLNKMKQKKKSSLEINVGYIINQYNYEELYILAKQLKKVGVHYLRFKTDIASLLNMNDNQRKIAKDQINKIKNELCDDKFKIVEIHNVLDDRDKKRDFKKCFVHYLIGNVSADGRVYPCNYHPKKNGYSFGSAIDNKFSEIWYNMLDYEIDKKIPSICPPVCDPFKNRANRLLETIYNIYEKQGLDYLIECIKEIEKEIENK